MTNDVKLRAIESLIQRPQGHESSDTRTGTPSTTVGTFDFWSEVAERTKWRRERSGSRNVVSEANAATGLSLCHNGRTTK